MIDHNAIVGATIAISVLLVLSPELRESIVDQFARWRRRAKRIFVKEEAYATAAFAHRTNLTPGSIIYNASPSSITFNAPPPLRDVEFDKETNARIVELFADRNLRVTYSKDSPDTIFLSDPCNAFHFMRAGEIPFQEFFEKVYGDDAQMESVMFKMKYG